MILGASLLLIQVRNIVNVAREVGGMTQRVPLCIRGMHIWAYRNQYQWGIQRSNENPSDDDNAEDSVETESSILNLRNLQKFFLRSIKWSDTQIWSFNEINQCNY